MSDDRCCGNCDFWKMDDSEDMGECRRDPPKILEKSNLNLGHWPKTHEHDWCGEFEMK
jgi:hypothetical protein